MLTDEEAQRMAGELWPLIRRYADSQGITDVHDMVALVERLLIEEGFQCKDGVWQVVQQ